MHNSLVKKLTKSNHARCLNKVTPQFRIAITESLLRPGPVWASGAFLPVLIIHLEPLFIPTRNDWGSASSGPILTFFYVEKQQRKLYKSKRMAYL